MYYIVAPYHILYVLSEKPINCKLFVVSNLRYCLAGHELLVLISYGSFKTPRSHWHHMQTKLEINWLTMTKTARIEGSLTKSPFFAAKEPTSV